jgi:hypothetical protein
LFSLCSSSGVVAVALSAPAGVKDLAQNALLASPLTVSVLFGEQS